jgi:aspartate aminotransferase
VVSTRETIVYNIAKCLNDGDEKLILPAPYWVSYFEMKLSGGVPVEVPTSVDTDFKITPEQLEAQLHQKQNDVVLLTMQPICLQP